MVAATTFCTTCNQFYAAAAAAGAAPPALQSVEWDMLLFFAAQFVMVECAAEIGMIDMIGGWLESIIRSAPAQQRTLVAVQILLWASAVISGILVSSEGSSSYRCHSSSSSSWPGGAW
jgi:Na+/H+ antiporter NhaD/arsenite permease-like protein